MISWGFTSAAGPGQGLANWWYSLCSLWAALGVSSRFRGLPLSLVGTKICPAHDSFQRSLAASPGSWLFLKRQEVVATAIWKQKWCSGALMLQERAVAQGCPHHGWGWLFASRSPLEGEARRVMGMQYPSVLPFIPCAGSSLCPQESVGETQQPALWLHAKDFMKVSVPFLRALQISVAWKRTFRAAEFYRSGCGFIDALWDSGTWELMWISIKKTLRRAEGKQISCPLALRYETMRECDEINGKIKANEKSKDRLLYRLFHMVNWEIFPSGDQIFSYIFSIAG